MHQHCIGIASNAAFLAAPEKRQQPGLAVITWSNCTSLWLCLSSFWCHCSQMPGPQNHPATHKQRWQAVNLKDLHPELSYRQIGSKIGKTFVSKWIRLARLHSSVADQQARQTTQTECKSHSAYPGSSKAKAMQICCRYGSQSSAQFWLESQCKPSAARSQKTGPKTPQAQGSANADGKAETHKDRIRHCSPENRHSVLAQHHDHQQQHFQNACHGKASWQLVYPSTRETVGRPKHSLGVHCYIGMTCWYVTTLKFVTGTHKLAQCCSRFPGSHSASATAAGGAVLLDSLRIHLPTCSGGLQFIGALALAGQHICVCSLLPATVIACLDISQVMQCGNASAVDLSIYSVVCPFAYVCCCKPL